MANGKIKWFDGQKGFGFIARSGEADIFVHINQWRGPAGTKPQENDKVSFDIGPGKKGLEARNVQPLQASPRAQPQTPALTTASQQSVSPVSPGSDDYHFLNPYNFVRYLEARPQGHILGDCPPPPHDRYVGLTGRITCEVEAVTPLFISDSHGIETISDGKKEHKIYRFFEYAGQPTLPASSLRGMVRSVYEAVTNSCFGVFQEDKPYPLEHREARAPDMIPARVIELTETGALLEALDCTSNAPTNVTGHPTTVRAGAVLKSYPRRVFNQHTQQAFNPAESHLPVGAYDGMRVAALVTRNPVPHRSNRFRSFQAQRVVPEAQHTELNETTELVKVFGWLHLTGPNIENKHDERLFFRWDDKTPGIPVVGAIPKRYLYPCNASVVAEYNHHLVEYWGRLQGEVEGLGNRRWPNSTQGVPHPSTFVEKDRQLRVGDLVYFQRDACNKVSLLRSVSMPRIRYTYPRQKLLPETNKKCKVYENLCPACRTFGWVHEDAQEIALDKITAYAGRVRFSHGAYVSGKQLDDITLAILGSPKPTTTQFYLLKDNSSGKLVTDGAVNYNDEEARLRGRKFYRHHGEANPQEYTRAPENNPLKDDQNRTVRGALDTGARFTFTVDFENLECEELGALLWTLELEPEMCHRLGFAKPLGFGSVKLTVTELALLSPAQRYGATGLEESGWVDALPTKANWVEAFRAALSKIYHHPFAQLQNVVDLQALLSPPPALPIHYPRSTAQPDPEGKNFEWFMENKRRRLTLSLAEDESRDQVVAGLPLLRRR